jgi:phage FluMu gp28-like protein
MPRFKAAFEDGTLDALPRDEQCRDDLRAIKRINGVPKLPNVATQRAGAGGEGAAKVQRHGDFAIGLFLANYALRQEGMPGRCDGFESTPRRTLGNFGNAARSCGAADDYKEAGAQSRHML